MKESESESGFKVRDFEVYRSILQRYMGFYHEPETGYGPVVLGIIHSSATYEYKLLVDMGFIENV